VRPTCTNQSNEGAVDTPSSSKYKKCDILITSVGRARDRKRDIMNITIYGHVWLERETLGITKYGNSCTVETLNITKYGMKSF